MTVGGIGSVNVNANYLSVNSVKILGVATGNMAIAHVVGTTSISERDIEISIRPELEGAGVMVTLRLVNAENFPPAARMNPVRVIWINKPFRDYRLMIV